MRGLILSCMMLLIASCTHKHWKVGECRSYYKMIRTNWRQDDKEIYYFNGLVYPDGWERANYKKYFKEDCLIKLPKKKIVKLFGQPTKTYFSPKRDLYVYCMDSTCLDREIYGRVALYFDFKNGVVSEVFTSPSPEY